MSQVETESPLASFLAGIDIRIGRAQESMQKTMRQAVLEARRAEQPRFIPVYGTVTVGSTGVAVITFDNKGPDQGHLWYLRKLVIGGVTPGTTANGRADVYVRADDISRLTDATKIGTVGWRDQATTLPLAGDFSPGELVVQYGERLFVVLSSATNAQVYVASGMVQDIMESAAKPEWTL